MLNRSMLVVKAREPFLRWLKSLPDPVRDDLTLEEVNEDGTAFLLPEWEDDQERNRVLRECYRFIFEEQLSGWWTRESDWPKKRTFQVFQSWFDVEMHSVVEDLVDGPLFDDD